jgi:O-antigen/teichoic acid export membrane protein
MTGFALELWHVVVAVGGLLALSNLDLLLARAYLPAQAAGLYAAGSLATKAVYWAPQFVAVTVFPRLTDPVARRRLMPVAVAVVAGIGLSATVLAALLGGRLIELLVGPAYTSLGNTLWAFCLLGGLLAVAQLFVSAALAVRDRTVARLVWAACVLEVALVGGLLHRSVFQVVGAATLSAAALVVACAMGYRRASTAAGGAVSAAAPRPA